nr:hypothetical protein [Streptomyces sp. NBC_01476]
MAEHLNFGRAAIALHLAQPSLRRGTRRLHQHGGDLVTASRTRPGRPAGTRRSRRRRQLRGQARTRRGRPRHRHPAGRRPAQHPARGPGHPSHRGDRPLPGGAGHPRQ